MEKSNIETIEETEIGIETNSYFQYSEEEQEEIKIAKANSKLVFCPKFIPFYPELLEYGLTHLEILLYGFIEFYLSSSKNETFYFTNEQLCKLIGVGNSTITDGIAKLTKIGIIKPKYRIKAGGGKIRFINSEDCNFRFQKTAKQATINRQTVGNNNKKKKNIYIEPSLSESQNRALQGTTGSLPSKDIDPPPNEPPPPLPKNIIPPTLEAVKEYAKKIGFRLNCEQFVDYYTSRGWMVGKCKMKDWQAAVRTWMHNNKDNQKSKRTPENVYIPKESDYNSNLKTLSEAISDERARRLQ